MTRESRHHTRASLREAIREEARRLGFAACGVSRAGFLAEEAPRLERWLRAGMHGDMGYMERHFDERLDPRRLVRDARSVISLRLGYFAGERPGEPKISKYAWGEDYHFVVKQKLQSLIEFIGAAAPDVQSRGFVDSAPVLEKAWAARAGLGWIGKNANLITAGAGSFHFVAEIVTELDLEPDTDAPAPDRCGACTRCIDACPTGAIVEPRVVDGRRCIAYFTIELRGEIPETMRGRFDGWAFGCDVCQDVCPWNRFARPHGEPAFAPRPGLLEMDHEAWASLTEARDRELFRRSAVQRAGYEGLRRNLAFLADGGSLT